MWDLHVVLTELYSSHSLCGRPCRYVNPAKMTLIGWTRLRGSDGEGLGKVKSKQSVFYSYIWNCMFLICLKVVFVNISIFANYYYRLCFPLFYDNFAKMVFVIRIQVVYGFGKIFRKGVHVLTLRFSKSLERISKWSRTISINVLNQDLKRLFQCVTLCVC